MYDPRFDKLSDVLIGHSVKLQPRETVLIEAIDSPDELVVSLIRRSVEADAVPLVTIKRPKVLRALYQEATEHSMRLAGDVEAFRMKQVDAYIGIRGSHNITELSDVPHDKMKLYQAHWLDPVHFKIRVPKTRWVILRYPTSSMAQQAGMSTEAFETFFFDVCTMDYGRLNAALQPLAERMRRTDRVRITGPNTDLSFSIKNISVVACAGRHNIPDGEVFTAPVRDSVNGTIQFNTPTIYQGTAFNDIRLTFKDGRISDAHSENKERLNDILDTDAGARYVGEFAVGVNPHITRPMRDILFDEKIAGSFHFTPGNAYEDADNGNRSQVHWDMVMRQTPDAGGGEISFDGELIRKDGLFVVSDLFALNPDQLLKPRN